MNLNYELFMEKQFDESFMFSIYLNQYIKDMNSLKLLIKKKIHKCKFRKNTKMEGMYYLPHINDTPVLNSIDLSQNIMITGPNAAGKTTILKSTLINIIFTQQFGCGFYESAKLSPFKHIHCYLNIPDTSGRDSLFQAEARRCKEILDIIIENKKDSHFCAFDELYSVTIPGIDPYTLDTRKVNFSSYDGTSIPMFIFGTKKIFNEKCQHDAALYAHGSFGISVQPSFSLTILLYAYYCNAYFCIVNARGGSEKGAGWHHQAKKANKIKDNSEK
jgi:energy-coupling factor transporter ATP-binding protein EcfA2